MSILAYLFISVAHAQVAVNPNSYLVFATPSLAHARSAQQCQLLPHPCQAGTTEWWNVVTLTDGTGAIELPPTGTNPNIIMCDGTCGLTPTEQAQLQTAAALGTKLPSVNTTQSVGPSP